MNEEAAMFSRRGTRVKIMILWESTRRLSGKQRRGKDDFRFSFFPPFPSFLSLPFRGKFERAESMKGAENKGTTIVEGTKTSSLKFQRPAWSREKIKKRRRRHFELKEKKRRERGEMQRITLYGTLYFGGNFSFVRLFEQLSRLSVRQARYTAGCRRSCLSSLCLLTEWIRFV